MENLAIDEFETRDLVRIYRNLTSDKMGALS